MSLLTASLNSGSNGNCYYIANEKEAILIDAGISCRETERRMSKLGLSMQKIKAIFISHEHIDHIRGVRVLAKKYSLPVYITSSTLRYSKLILEAELINTFTAYEPVNIGQLEITAFPKKHDASDPHSFIISGNGVKIGVFTDIGASCKHVIKNFNLCNAAFLETNYDTEMLEKGNYPYHLKRRISGEKGHLSNQQALAIFLAHKPKFMSHLFLSHLSKDNNCPELARRLFIKNTKKVHVVVASRYIETAVYRILKGPLTDSKKNDNPLPPSQLSLF
ncbi:MAG: MBL fold metallo-hydrolase [Bacteroidota bacterium]|nr:MBL fold metallo-hydrolase [Bacteroidota bacterium]